MKVVDDVFGNIPEDIPRILHDGVEFFGFSADLMEFVYYMYTDRERDKKINQMSKKGNLGKLIAPVLGSEVEDKVISLNGGNIPFLAYIENWSTCSKYMQHVMFYYGNAFSMS